MSLVEKFKYIVNNRKLTQFEKLVNDYYFYEGSYESAKRILNEGRKDLKDKLDLLYDKLYMETVLNKFEEITQENPSFTMKQKLEVKKDLEVEFNISYVSYKNRYENKFNLENSAHIKIVEEQNERRKKVYELKEELKLPGELVNYKTINTSSKQKI